MTNRFEPFLWMSSFLGTVSCCNSPGCKCSKCSTFYQFRTWNEAAASVHFSSPHQPPSPDVYSHTTDVYLTHLEHTPGKSWPETNVGNYKFFISGQRRIGWANIHGWYYDVKQLTLRVINFVLSYQENLFSILNSRNLLFAQLFSWKRDLILFFVFQPTLV
jgi:hypothetical protein